MGPAHDQHKHPEDRPRQPFGLRTRCGAGSVAGSPQWQFAVAVHVLTFLADTLEGSTVSSEELSTSTNINRAYVRPSASASIDRQCSSVVVNSQGGVGGGDTEDAATGRFVVGRGQGDVLGGGVAVAEELAQSTRFVQSA